MPTVRASAISWLGDDPFPGIISVVLTDADGKNWTFVDKSPIFTSLPITGATRFPVEVEIGCTIVEERGDRVVISTERPWGLEEQGGATRFTVRRDQVVGA
jgi:hypothetical protein